MPPRHHSLRARPPALMPTIALNEAVHELHRNDGRRFLVPRSIRRLVDTPEAVNR